MILLERLRAENAELSKKLAAIVEYAAKEKPKESRKKHAKELEKKMMMTDGVRRKAGVFCPRQIGNHRGKDLLPSIEKPRSDTRPVAVCVVGAARSMFEKSVVENVEKKTS